MQNLIRSACSSLTATCLTTISVCCLFHVVGTAQADTLRMADGYAFSQSQFKELTVDGGYRIADNSQRYGLRLALPVLAESIVPFAELSRAQGELTDLAATSDVDFTDHSAGGIGFFFTGLPEWRDMSLSLRLSRNEETIDTESNITVSGFQASARVKSKALSLSLLLSPKTALMKNGTNGYLAVGLTHNRSRTAVLVDDRPEPALSRSEENVDPYLAAGIVYPLGRLRFYGVLDYEHEVSLAVGVRLHVSSVATD